MENHKNAFVGLCCIVIKMVINCTGIFTRVLPEIRGVVCPFSEVHKISRVARKMHILRSTQFDQNRIINEENIYHHLKIF